MKCTCDEHENGNIYEGQTRSGKNYCVFEDTQETQPRYYGFVGSWEDHDTSAHIQFESLIEAKEFFESQYKG